MIKIWKETKTNIIRTAILEKNCLVNIVQPDPLEIETMKRDYGIPDDIIQDILDIDERSRCERDDGIFSIILRVPVHHTENKIPYSTIPLGIVIADNIIIAISREEIDIFNELLEKGIFLGTFSDPIKFVLLLFLNTSKRYLLYLKEINKESTQIENELQKSIKNTELIRLLKMEKSLVFFTTSLRGNELLLEKLKKSFFKNLNDITDELLDDVIIEIKQAIEVANIYSNILSGMMDAFASVISNNLNIIMKRLTMISIILMIPTLFASLYGMNVKLPWGHSPFAFLGIITVSVLFVITSIIIFLSKRFFKA
ncbi:MAG: magnesium transporter CorA family protein [Spirochaetales bacterium]|nr:magnesium transporter CorA family protein [Spirochaetales bacterium]